MDLLTGEKRYNPKDIAKEFNVSHATVLRWIKTGDLHAVQYKGSWKVPETSLKMFIENSRST